jgi:hypothetical protein
MSLPNWPDNVIKSIQDAVDAEAQRIKIAAKFLPLPQNVVTPGTTTIQSDIVRSDFLSTSLNVNEGETTSFYQITVQFRLTDAQYGDTVVGPTTAITLATRATNLLSQAEDIQNSQRDLPKWHHTR